MKRVVIKVLAILLATINIVSVFAGTIRIHAAGRRTRDDICRIAYEELGKRDGSRYGARAGEAWCIFFLQWLARQTGLNKNEWPNIAGTNSLVYWFKEHDQWYPDMDYYYGYNSGIGYYETGGTSGYEPRPGDVIIINNDSSKEPEHGGMVYSVNSETIVTIEGNISNKVVMREYSRETRHLISGGRYENKRVQYIGFCSPKFDDDYEEKTVYECSENCISATYKQVQLYIPKTFDTSLFSTDLANSPSTKLAADSAYSLYTGKVFRDTKLSNGGCTWKRASDNGSIFQIGYSNASDAEKLKVIYNLMRYEGACTIIRLGDIKGISLLVIGVRKDVDVSNISFDDFVVYYPYAYGFRLLSELKYTEHWYSGLLDNQWSLIVPYTGKLYQGFKVKN